MSTKNTMYDTQPSEIHRRGCQTFPTTGLAKHQCIQTKYNSPKYAGKCVVQTHLIRQLLQNRQNHYFHGKYLH